MDKRYNVEVIDQEVIKSAEHALDLLQSAEIEELIENEGEDSVVGAVYGKYQVMGEKEYRDPNKTGSFIFFPDVGRITIEYGADYKWADVDSIAQGLDLYFSSPDEYDSRN